MKTPWRFLADLTSRRRPAKPEESSTGRSADAEASESEAKSAPAVPSDAAASGAHVSDDRSPAISSETESVHDAGAASEPPVDAAEVQSPALADAQAPLFGAVKTGAGAKPQRKPPAKRQGSPKRTQADVVAKSLAASDRAPVAPSRDPFFDDVARLDEEIRALRSELAQKLHRQNAQLKKMLERFDRA
ncbi:hypothetical protein ATY77_00385 [Rhizobium sp. R634]|uniref:hypothetical protein n=1 Tax=Rhizobium sp. R634 TaxID=1764274 RepID=UPI000B531785|nr:hypothetical protein [Rhizobium sp. R634]OWV81746.1 hypothetical protein ATY77_00385 [Rhizobium sp. R634]